MISRFPIDYYGHQYGCRYFIETGTGAGEGIRYAEQFQLFQKCFSCEIEKELFDRVRDLNQHSKIEILNTSSEQFLETILPKLNPKDPVLFWLDAHFPGADFGLKTYDEVKQKDIRLPLERELTVIKKYRPENNDVFIIDDLRIYEDGPFQNGLIPAFADTLPAESRNLRFVERDFSASHRIQKDYRDEGYLLLFPHKMKAPSFCPVCQTQSNQQWLPQTWKAPFSKDAFTLLECDDCGSIFCAPRPTPAQLVTYYEKFFNFDWYEQHIIFKKIQGWHRWQRMQPLIKQYHLSKGRVLDIGCGHGFFLSSAKKSGWDAVGMDFPSKATHYAKQAGLSVFERDLNTLSHLPGVGKFDLITLWHCLEHFSDPFEVLSNLKQLLEPNGKILIAVPNGACEGMRLRKNRWVWCQEPFVHTVHFTPKSLSRMVKNSGFQPLAVWSRDTWDANRLYDIHLEPKLTPVSAQTRKHSRKLSFWLEESSRLLCYAAGGFRHWALGQEFSPEKGSELLVLAGNSQ